MLDPTKTLQILAISGSLRAASHNTRLLRALPPLAPEGMAFKLFEGLGDVPPYNADHDVDPPPAGVRALREAVGAADGLVIATPEYNHSVPGVLKNALDWASRPMGTILTGKCVVVLVATPGRASGFLCLADLGRMLRDLGNFVVAGPQVVLHEVHTKLPSEGSDAPTLQDPVACSLIAMQLRALAQAIRSDVGVMTGAPIRELIASRGRPRDPAAR
jgi:chromate reductase